MIDPNPWHIAGHLPRNAGVFHERSIMASSVAVIMRTRDRALLLHRALESVERQTLRDYELIVVNDGGEPSLVEQVVAEHPGLAAVRIVHNPTSVGREEATNVGVAASDSELIAFLDDDDTWAPDYLAAVVDRLSTSGDGAAAVRTEVVYEEIDGDVVIELRRELLKTDSTQVTLTESAISNFVPPSSLVVRRSEFDAVGGWDGRLPVLADWDFVLKLLRRTTIAFIDGAPLAFWHRREAQTGALGNSVHDGAALHRAFDLSIRDAYLKQDLESGAGMGQLLFAAELYRREGEREWWGRQEVIKRADMQFAEVIDRLLAIHDRLDSIDSHLRKLDVDLRRQAANTLQARLRRAARRVVPKKAAPQNG